MEPRESFLRGGEDAGHMATLTFHLQKHHGKTFLGLKRMRCLPPATVKYVCVVSSLPRLPDGRTGKCG
jgi:hypothetical protein